MPTHPKVRTALIALTCTLSIAAFAETPKPISVPAGDLAAALETIARQAGVELLFDMNDLKGLQTRGVSGTFTAEVAIRKLLQGTHFDVSTDESTGAMMIGKRKPAVSLNASPATGDEGATAWALRLAQSSSSSQGEGRGEDLEKTIGEAQPGDSTQSQNKVEVEEVVVTAQKRGEERLQDVPIPVTVLDGDTLASNSQVRLRDYAHSIPSFVVAPRAQGSQVLALRGITTGTSGTPTVGVLVDDVPFGNFSSSIPPEIDPGDLERIEVLRGPQGTLYGASAMGGLLKYVTKDPSLAGYSGRLEAGSSSVRHGDDPGYSLRAAANIPLTESVAIRVSGFTRQEPGYVDNPISRLEDVNELHTDGARLAALWKASEDLSVSLSAVYQNMQADGQPDVVVAPGLGELQQNRLPNSGTFVSEAQAYSAIVKYHLGGVDLTSVSGYNTLRYDIKTDFPTFYARSTAFLGVPSGSIVDDRNRSRKFTQEMRITGSMGSRIDWLAGGYYTDEHNPAEEDILAANLATGVAGPALVNFKMGSSFEEYAGFADLTYRFTDRLDVQIGGRSSHITVIQDDQSSTGPASSPFNSVTNPFPTFTPSLEFTDTVSTYLFSPRLKLTEDFMIYARAASGYRPGQNNGAPARANGAPPGSSADRTENYEIGVKADFWDRKLALDVSLYHIDWKNIQFRVIPANGFGYQTNGAGAKSEGVDLSLSVKPLQGLTIGGWVAYDNAVLTEPFPNNATLYGAPGDRLPMSSRVSGNLSIDQRFPLRGRAMGFVGATAKYTGDRVGLFTGTPGHPAPRQAYAGYTESDLRAGVQIDTWTTTLYANNVTDKRGLLNGGIGYTFSDTFIYNQPRTIGVSIAKSFP